MLMMDCQATRLVLNVRASANRTVRINSEQQSINLVPIRFDSHSHQTGTALS